MDYYDNFRVRLTSGSVTSDWHCLGKGIITGRTVSVTLFALAMNMVVKPAEVAYRGPLSRSAPDKSLYGQPYRHNNISPGEQVDLARTGETNHLG